MFWRREISLVPARICSPDQCEPSQCSDCPACTPHHTGEGDTGNVECEIVQYCAAGELGEDILLYELVLGWKSVVAISLVDM
jgi:hypothetical protein